MKKAFVGIVLLITAIAAAAFAAGPDFSTEGSVWGDAYFARGSAALSPEAKKDLAKAAEWIKKRRNPMVLLAGYDEQGTPADRSAELGWKRAAAVEQALVESGVDRAVIKSISFGNSRSAGVGEDGKAKDRRVRYRAVDTGASGGEKSDGGMPAGVCQRCKNSK